METPKRKRGRPPKQLVFHNTIFEDVETKENVKMAVATDVNSVEYHIQNNINVKVMTRKFGKTGGYISGGVPTIDVDRDLSAFVSAGYKIVYVVLIEQDAEVLHFLFVLTKQ